MTSATSPADRSRLRRNALLSATMLATGLAAPAEAALFKVVVTQVTDPMLAGLSIPATAPTRGLWSSVYDWPINAIALGLMPNGKVVSYGSPVNEPGVQDGRTFDVWDPTQGFTAGGAHTTLQGVVGVNSFCSSQTFRLDGTMMSAGGIFDNGVDKGSVVLNSGATAITPNTAKLADDRYYSTMLTLPTGQQLIMGGTYPYAAGFGDPQGSINNGYNTGMTPELYDGTQWNSLFGANSRDAFGPDNSRYWYPRAWIAPNGKVFGISSDNMWYLDPTGSGKVTAMAFKAGPQSANTAVAAPNTGPASTAVMYDVGKILQVGGNSFTNGDGFLSSSLATTIDINGTTPALADTAPMTYGRAWANSTVLPTGQVAVTGGSLYNDTAGYNTVLQTEIWSPSSGQWTAAAAAAIYRGYHSTVILMPNGTLLSAGGGAPGPVNNQNAEIYYPPYLFTSTRGTATLAPRPSIVSLSGLKLSYNQSLKFELASQNGLSQVVLIGTSLVTHSFNSTQRRIPASFSHSGNTVTVQGPASSNVAPPGYYQLVAIDKNGVPSPGIIVALGASVTPPTQATAFVAAAQGGTTTGGTGTAGGTGTSGGGTTSSGGTGTGGSGTPGGAGTTGGTSAISQWPASTASWQQVGIAVTRIGVAADGTLLGVNSTDQSIWLNGVNKIWTKLAGTAKDIASVSGNSVYTITNDGGVFHYNIGANTIKLVGWGSSTISAAADGTIAVTGTNNNIWVKVSDSDDTIWYQIPGQAKRVAAMNQNSFYAIGMDDNVYHADKTGNWVQIGNSVSDIATSADGSVMVINKYTGALWRKIGDDNNQYWTQQTTAQPATAIAIPNAQRAVMVGKDQNIYRW